MEAQHLTQSVEQYGTVPSVEAVSAASRDEVGFKRLFQGLGHVAQGVRSVAQGVAEGFGPLVEPYTHTTPAQVGSFRKP